MERIRRRFPTLYSILMLIGRKRVSKSYRDFRHDMSEYEKKGPRDAFHICREDIYPILNETGKEAGSLDIHYFLQDIYVARKIIEEKPDVHYDIGSRVDGFIAHLLAGKINVTLLDIRPLTVMVEGLKFMRADAADLSVLKANSLKSISSLHAAEHFGLGRYGDAVDPDACFAFMQKIQKKIQGGGVFVFQRAGKQC